MKIHKFINGKTAAILENDTHISKWVIESGRLDHDRSLLPIIAKHIPTGGTVIDVGAYIGDHTIFYARCVGRTGLVVAFEPNREPFDCLAYNMQEFEQVHILNNGASDRNHTISIAQDANVGASRPKEGNDIDCMTIDSLNLKACDFIKMDCEGFELKALKGAKETILRHKPVMLIEINDHALQAQGLTRNDVLKYIEELGYDYRNVYDGHSMDGVQLDIICKHRTK